MTSFDPNSLMQLLPAIQAGGLASPGQQQQQPRGFTPTAAQALSAELDKEKQQQKAGGILTSKLKNQEFGVKLQDLLEGLAALAASRVKGQEEAFVNFLSRRNAIRSDAETRLQQRKDRARELDIQTDQAAQERNLTIEEKAKDRAAQKDAQLTGIEADVKQQQTGIGAQLSLKKLDIEADRDRQLKDIEARLSLTKLENEAADKRQGRQIAASNQQAYLDRLAQAEQRLAQNLAPGTDPELLREAAKSLASGGSLSDLPANTKALIVLSQDAASARTASELQAGIAKAWASIDITEVNPDGTVATDHYGKPKVRPPTQEELAFAVVEGRLPKPGEMVDQSGKPLASPESEGVVVPAEELTVEEASMQLKILKEDFDSMSDGQIIDMMESKGLRPDVAEQLRSNISGGGFTGFLGSPGPDDFDSLIRGAVGDKKVKAPPPGNRPVEVPTKARNPRRSQKKDG